MRALLLITGKDLRQRLRDRSALLTGIVAPLGLAFILGSILGGIDGGATLVTIAAAAEDGGDAAGVLMTQVLPAVDDSGAVDVEVHRDRAAVEAAVEAGEAGAGIVVPSGFSRAVMEPAAAELEVITSIEAPIAAEVAGGIAEGFASQLRRSQVAVGALMAADVGLSPDEIVARVLSSPPVLDIGAVQTEVRQMDPKSYLAAGMAVFFLFFTVSFGITSILEERREGTLQRLLAAPIGSMTVYGGKALTSFALGVVSMLVLAVGTALLLGARWGDPLGVALLIVAGVTAATGVMAVLASFARTAEQANVWQSVVAVVLGALGGAFFPVGSPGSWLERLSLLTPHQWFLRGLGDLAGDGGASLVVLEAGVLVGMGAVGWAVTMLRTRGEVAL